MQEEKIIDIKGTFSQFIKADEPELSQEEAIIKYTEPKSKKKNNSEDDNTDNTEEQEHLKRIKRELLASLERVKKLERQIFRDSQEQIKLKIKKEKSSEEGKQKYQALDRAKEDTNKTNITTPKERE